MAKEKPFNNPFAALKAPSKPEAPKPATPAPSKAAPPPPPKTAKPSKQQQSADDEAALFLAAVGGVEPVKIAKDRVAPAVLAAQAVKTAADDSESLVQLAELVASEVDFEVEEALESVEGRVRDFDVRVLRKLKAGEFKAQAELDLHGKTREAARPALERFILDARVQGHRCVRVITGRGLNSPDGVPVLRALAVDALTRGRLARAVLAFCSARPNFGGVGALDVLLRR
jgi:DNA-nicking Smr family endonuclease